jgi:hypothetical protein
MMKDRKQSSCHSLRISKTFNNLELLPREVIVSLHSQMKERELLLSARLRIKMMMTTLTSEMTWMMMKKKLRGA